MLVYHIIYLIYVIIQNITKQYKTDNHLVYSCQYHVIFCPKYRRPVLADKKIANRLNELILEKQEVYRYNVLDIEILSDHVHLLLDVNPKDGGIFRSVNMIKGYTSNALRKEFPELKSRLPTLWTQSKFISSVGEVTLETIKQYLDKQRGV